MQPIYQYAKFVSNLRMTLTNDDIRKLNLKILIKEVGKKSTLAQLADTDPAYISQVLSTKSKKPRNIGENLARKLEIACGKNRGWMDVYHPNDENTIDKDKTHLNESALASDAEALADLPEEAKKLIHDLINLSSSGEIDKKSIEILQIMTDKLKK